LPSLSSHYTYANIPKDTTLLTGKAAENKYGKGGGNQYFIETPFVDKQMQLVREDFHNPTKHIGGNAIQQGR
jgi:hypothetical protein